DRGVVGGAATPPAGIIVIRGVLVEPALLIIVRTAPLGCVDGPLLHRWVNAPAGDLLGHDAELLQRLAGPAADAELQSIEILDGFDLLSKPSAHLRTGIAGDKTIDIRFLGEFVHEFHAVA